MPRLSRGTVTCGCWAGAAACGPGAVGAVCVPHCIDGVEPFQFGCGPLPQLRLLPQPNDGPSFHPLLPLPQLFGPNEVPWSLIPKLNAKAGAAISAILAIHNLRILCLLI